MCMRIRIAMMGHLLDPDLNPGVKKGAGNCGIKVLKTRKHISVPVLDKDRYKHNNLR